MAKGKLHPPPPDVAPQSIVNDEVNESELSEDQTNDNEE